MPRRELIRTIRRAARAYGVGFELKRQGAEHEVWRCGDQLVTIPRHREINRYTAEAIMRQLERTLGKAWWR